MYSGEKHETNRESNPNRKDTEHEKNTIGKDC
jgi:hypothetical protein